MLGDNALECMYFVNVAREAELGMVDLSLELCENGCGGRCRFLGSFRGVLGGGRVERSSEDG
jgi:hypothetical protein